MVIILLLWLSDLLQSQSSFFDKLAEEIKSKDAVFLLVAVRVKEKELLKYNNEFHISIRILIYRDGSVSKAYSVWGHHEPLLY
jgi:hypothetical protein